MFVPRGKNGTSKKVSSNIKLITPSVPFRFGFDPPPRDAMKVFVRMLPALPEGKIVHGGGGGPACVTHTLTPCWLLLLTPSRYEEEKEEEEVRHVRERKQNKAAKKKNKQKVP